jgi:hypothetical protein
VLFFKIFFQKNLRQQVLNHCPILLPHIDSVATSTKGKVGKHFFFQVSAKYFQGFITLLTSVSHIKIMQQFSETHVIDLAQPIDLIFSRG